MQATTWKRERFHSVQESAMLNFPIGPDVHHVVLTVVYEIIHWGYLTITQFLTLCKISFQKGSSID